MFFCWNTVVFVVWSLFGKFFVDDICILCGCFIYLFFKCSLFLKLCFELWSYFEDRRFVWCGCIIICSCAIFLCLEWGGNCGWAFCLNVALLAAVGWTMVVFVSLSNWTLLFTGLFGARFYQHCLTINTLISQSWIHDDWNNNIFMISTCKMLFGPTCIC